MSHAIPASHPFSKFVHSSANYNRGAEKILFPGNKKVRFLNFFSAARYCAFLGIRTRRLAVGDTAGCQPALHGSNLPYFPACA
jgi:hypothetical protein